VIWVAAILGAVVGSIAVGRFASACSCEPPSWTVRLAEAPSEDATVWPARAKLEASSSTASLTARDASAAKIDYIGAGGQ